MTGENWECLGTLEQNIVVSAWTPRETEIRTDPVEEKGEPRLLRSG